jgi:tetratricopeptide (TPR) repeat protein
MTRCPASDRLERLLAEQLAEPERGAVEAHIEGCAACQEALGRMAGGPAGRPGERPPAAGRPARQPLDRALLHRLEEALPGPPAGVGQADALPGAPPTPKWAASPTAENWPQPASYEVLGELGRGGMGIVYKARHRALNRLVALKLLRDAAYASSEEVARFRREAQAVARLQHPPIVQIFEVGEHDGRPFLALEYVEGGSLAQRLDGTPLPARQAAQLAQTLAHAMDVAHQRGVVHRDLKPANVLLTGDGSPKVTDFGLAKRLDATAQTQSGAILGTPSYMAPEQAAGKGTVVGPAADVYALGAVLYELLTGRPPFKAETPLDTLLLVQSAEPVPPSRMQPKVPRDLETICLKCLQKEPRKRYPSAEALADDLRRFLADRPIQARRTPWTEQARRWCRRNPARAALAAAVALLVLGTFAFVLWYQHDRADQAAEQARREATIAVKAAQTGQAVSVAWQEANTLMDQMHGRLDDPEQVNTLLDDLAQWGAALHKARSALTRAEALLAREEAAPDPAIEGQLQTLKARLDADEHDHLFVTRFEEIRLEQSWVGVAKSGYDDEAFPKLKDAFKAYGMEFGATAPEDAVTWIHQRPEPIAKHVLAALDVYLAGARGEDAETRQWLAAVLKAADTDPWRSQARAATAAHDWPAVEKLVTEGKAAQQAPAFLLLLVRWFPQELEPSKLALLQQVQRTYPGDFWTNHELAYTFAHSKPPRWDEALRYMTAALALRPRNPTVHVHLGAVLQGKGDLDGAAGEYRLAIRLDPKREAAHSNLGLALQAQHDLEGAIAEFRHAVTLNPQSAHAHAGLGTALWDRGDRDEALAEFRRALAIDSKDVNARLNLGSALKALNDLPGAITEYRRALAIDPRHAIAHFNLGTALLARGDRDEAIAELRQATLLDPEYGDAHSNLGTALQANNDLDGAVAAYSRAIALDPTNAVEHYNLGVALLARGDLDDAIAACRRALALDPKHVSAHVNLGLALRRKGDVNGAVDECRRAIALDPEDALAHYNLGLALEAKPDLEGAIAAYRLAIKLDPKNVDAHASLGNTLLAKGEPDEAIAAYRRVIQLDPKHVSAHINLGSALLARADADGAIAAYRRAIALNPKDAVAHYHLGVALMAKDDPDGAIDEYRQAVTLDPKYEFAYVNLGIALRATGDLNGAVAACREAIALDPKDVIAHFQLGLALHAKDDPDGAIAAYREAIKLDPKHALAHVNLGVLLQGQGQFAASLASLREGDKWLAAGDRRRPSLQHQIRQCERLCELDGKLAAVLRGQEEPATASEQLEYGQLCAVKRLDHDSARFYAAAFAADPKRADNLKAAFRYNAACAAALAGAGRPEGAETKGPSLPAPLAEQDRARWRKQALDWLQADLALWAKQLETGKPEGVAEVRQQLRHWQRDKDLAGVRAETALARLPENERKEWTQLWADVADLLKKATSN